MTSSDDPRGPGPRGQRPTYVTPRQFLDLAVEFEGESEAYYRGMMDRAAGDEARQLLDLLARQEHEHARILREFEPPAGGAARLQYAPSLTLSMPRPDSDNPGFDEMLEVAIRREQCSAEIYNKTAAMVRGRFRDLLEGLATFEREHEERLRSLQQYY